MLWLRALLWCDAPDGQMLNSQTPLCVLVVVSLSTVLRGFSDPGLEQQYQEAYADDAFPRDLVGVAAAVVPLFAYYSELVSIHCYCCCTPETTRPAFEFNPFSRWCASALGECREGVLSRKACTGR